MAYPSFIRTATQKLQWDRVAEGNKQAILQEYASDPVGKRVVEASFGSYSYGALLPSGAEADRFKRVQELKRGQMYSQKYVEPKVYKEISSGEIKEVPISMLTPSGEFKKVTITATPQAERYTETISAGIGGQTSTLFFEERQSQAKQIKQLPVSITDVQGRSIAGVAQGYENDFEKEKTKAYQAALGFGGFAEMEKVSRDKEAKSVYLDNEAKRIQKLISEANTTEEKERVNKLIDKYNKEAAKFAGLQAGEREAAVQIERRQYQNLEMYDPQDDMFKSSAEALSDAFPRFARGDIAGGIEQFDIGLSRIPLELGAIGGQFLSDANIPFGREIGTVSGGVVGGIATAIPAGASFGAKSTLSTIEKGFIPTQVEFYSGIPIAAMGLASFAIENPLETIGIGLGQAALFGWLNPKGKITEISIKNYNPNLELPVIQIDKVIRSGMGVKRLEFTRTTYPALTQAIKQATASPLPAYKTIMAGSLSTLKIGSKTIFEKVKVGQYQKAIGSLSEKGALQIERTNIGKGVRFLGKYGIGKEVVDMGRLSVTKILSDSGGVLPKSSITGLKTLTSKSIGAAEYTKSNILLRGQIYGTPSQVNLNLGLPSVGSKILGSSKIVDSLKGEGIKVSGTQEVQAALDRFKPSSVRPKITLPKQDIGTGLSTKQIQLSIPKQDIGTISLTKTVPYSGIISSSVRSSQITIPKIAPVIIPRQGIGTISVKSSVTLPQQDFKKALVPFTIPKIDQTTVQLPKQDQRKAIVPISTIGQINIQTPKQEYKRIFEPAPFTIPRLDIGQLPQQRKGVAPILLPRTYTPTPSIPRPSINIPDIGMPDGGFNFPILPLDFGGGGGRRGSTRIGIGRPQPKKYTPSVTAALFGIRGKSKKSLFTGIEIRPLIGKRTKRRKKKK